MDIPLSLPVARLSTVQRSMVAIARAFAESASVYFMDEPTTSLSDVEAGAFGAIRTLKETGASVIDVSTPWGRSFPSRTGSASCGTDPSFRPR